MSQEDFFKELGMESESGPDNKEIESKSEPESQTPQEKGRLPRPDDGLDFKCKICEDRKGGCAQCGWGRGES